MSQPERAFVYCRISEDRSEAALGVARQRMDCERLAADKGLDVLDVFIDNDISAYSGKPRPQYLAMLGRLSEVQHVLVWHTDRLHRRPQELEEYANLSIEHEILTHSVQGGILDLSTVQGRLNARMHAMIASYESELKAERSKRKAQQTILDGRSVSGQRSFGFDIVTTEDDRAAKRGGRYAINEREASALRVAVDEILGGRPMNSVRRDWNRSDREGGPLLTTRGTPWDPSNFRRMLVKPRNAGMIEWNGEVVSSEGTVPAILSPERWRRLCDYLDKRRTPGHSDKAVTLGAGIIHCPCGAKVKTWHVMKDRKKTQREHTYRCMQGTLPGVHPTKRVHLVDDVIRVAVWQWFGNPLRFELGVLSAEEEQRCAEIESALADLEHRVREVEGQFAIEGGLSMESLQRLLATLTARQTVLRVELTELRSRVSVEESPFLQAVERDEDQQRRFQEWSELNLEDQRDMLRSTFHITLHPTPKSAPRVFDPNTVEIRLLGPDGELPEDLPPETDPYDESDAASYLVPGDRVGHYPEGMPPRQRNAQMTLLVEHITGAGAERTE